MSNFDPAKKLKKLDPDNILGLSEGRKELLAAILLETYLHGQIDQQNADESERAKIRAVFEKDALSDGES